MPEAPGATPAPAWRAEIEGLHAFFEGWLGGTIPRSARRFRRVEDALAPGFTFVTPAGELLDRGRVLTGLREAHGSRPGLRIEVREPALAHEGRRHLVAVYREWQEHGAERTGRLSTVVFRKEEEGSNGLRWIHVHETWIRGHAAAP